MNYSATGADTVRFAATFPSILRPINEAVDLQQQFGGADGPIPVEGRPPFTDATQLIPPTSWAAKGIRIEDIVVVYQVGVVDFTSTTIRADRAHFVDVTAVDVTVIPVDGTTMDLIVNANPHVHVRPITTPTFFEVDNENITIEYQAVLANTGTIKVYGIGVHVSFNYN